MEALVGGGGGGGFGGRLMGRDFPSGLVGIGGRAWITMSIVYTDVPASDNFCLSSYTVQRG